jgi:hypothetical protein
MRPVCGLLLVGLAFAAYGRAGRQPLRVRPAGLLPLRNPARQFDKINHYAQDRIARFVANRHTRNSGYGLIVVVYQSAHRLGLINLEGTIVAPPSNRPWRPGR